MKIKLSEILQDTKTVAISGHIRPDGDCVGSCMALYLYIRTYFPDIDVNVYLDHPKPIFGHIESIDEIKTEVEEESQEARFHVIQGGKE